MGAWKVAVLVAPNPSGEGIYDLPEVQKKLRLREQPQAVFHDGSAGTAEIARVLAGQVMDSPDLAVTRKPILEIIREQPKRCLIISQSSHRMKQLLLQHPTKIYTGRRKPVEDEDEKNRFRLVRRVFQPGQVVIVDFLDEEVQRIFI